MNRALSLTTPGNAIFGSLAAAATILVGVSTTLPPARAQALEEAVAFFMWGLEDDARSSPLAANKWAIEDADGRTEGTSWYSKKVVNLQNGRVLQMIKDGSIDANIAAGGTVERLRRAYADFRTNHCSGHAVIGEVIVVDAPKGMIAVKHTGIEQPGLNLPEGTDRFRAQSHLLGGMIFNALRLGDKIKFSAVRVNGELVFTEVDRAK